LERVSSCGFPSLMPWLRTAMIVALPGHCSTTHSSAGIALRLQVMSRPRFTSR
jgi:hypothetical protein